MDADELARIAAELVSAVAEAKAFADEVGVGPRFRELVQHAREMHSLMLEALVDNEALSMATLRELSDTTAKSIDHLKGLALQPDGRMYRPRS